MRLYRILILFLSLISLTVGAAAEQDLPQCAVDCQSQIQTHHITSCATTDTTCLCADDHYQTTLSKCVSSNCTMRESLTAKRLGSRQCNIPIHQGRPEIDAATLVPLILATILVVNRAAAKLMRLGGGWGWDDYTIIVAYVSTSISTGLLVYYGRMLNEWQALAVIEFAMNASMIHYGFGKNMWDITPLNHITMMYKRFYAFVLIYKIQISLAKISVCLFLLRIFQSAAFRYTTYTIIGLNIAIAITWVFTDALRCIPVHLAWTGWAQEEQGKCIDFVAATMVNSFVNIVVDAAMVLMPVYEVIKLNLSWRKKLAVSVMFALGLVLTAVAILRVVVLYKNRWNTNPTVQLQPINHWSVIECHIAILCACLPMCRAMLARFFPGVLGGSGEQSYYPEGPSGRAARGPSHPSHRRSIAKTMSYSVDYSARPQHRASTSQVQLVEVGKDKS